MFHLQATQINDKKFKKKYRDRTVITKVDPQYQNYSKFSAKYLIIPETEPTNGCSYEGMP
jgi:hypothetical protein